MLKKMNKLKKCSAVVLPALLLTITLAGCGEVSLDPDDSGAYEKAVQALESADFDSALQLFTQADEVDGRTAESLRGQGLVFFEKGDYKKAADLFQQSLDAMRVSNKEFAEDVRYYLADCLARTGETTDAEVLYELLGGGDKPFLAHALLGKIYMQEGEKETAKEYFDKAVTENPDYATFLVIYDAYSEAHLEADGTEYLTMALELTPETAKDHADLGRIYRILKEDTAAKEQLQTAVDQGCAEAISILAGIYLDDGDISAARALYEKEIKDSSAPADGYNGLALCELAQDNADIALQYIEEGLRYEDDIAKKSLLFNQVLAYENLGDFETALLKANEFLLRYPNDEKMIKEQKFLSQ